MKRSAFAILACVLAVGCPGGKQPVMPIGAGTIEPPIAAKPKKTIAFRLSDADDRPEAPRKPAPTTALPDADAKKIIARLPDLPGAETKAFSLPDRTMPAPRTGKTVREAFPPPPTTVARPTKASGPLEVVRRAPDGPVGIAPHLSVTFSRPMVPIGSLDDLARIKPPVRIVPEPPGEWRWVGAQTVLFQPTKRFGMATKFEVEVPSGTKSVDGATLAAPVHWSFVTPPPKVLRTHPTGTSIALDPVLYVELDQDVVAKELLASIELTGRGKRVDLRLATAEELKADERVSELANSADGPSRFIAMKPARRLDPDTAYVLNVRAGAPSAEGPRRSDKDQTSTFTTFGPFRVEKSECGWDKRCRPLDSFRVDFTNEIDRKRFDKKMIAIRPEPADIRLEASGRSLTIEAMTRGRTKYEVTISGALRDVHGQALGEDKKLAFDVGSADPVLFGAESDMIVLSPGAAREWSVYSVNEPALRTRIYHVAPEDWAGYRKWLGERDKASPPGKLVVDRTVKPGAPPDELARTRIDLTGIGQAIVIVDDTRSGRDRSSTNVWVQSTELALDAFIEPDRVTGWATRLADGAPVEGADVVLLGAGSAKTDREGLARIALGAGTLLYAKKGDDVVILPERWYGDMKIERQARPDSVRWLVYDDRGTYKPGEEVHVKGWVRRAVLARGGDIDRVPGAKRVSFTIADPRGTEVGKGGADLDETGGFDLAFALPKDANLGSANLNLRLDGTDARANHYVGVQEFRRPEFQVSAKGDSAILVAGEPATANVTASYYAGGGLSDAKVEWQVEATPGWFTPPNRQGFHFGADDDRDDASHSEKHTGHTDARGSHRLRVVVDPSDAGFPVSLSLNASVEDKNRQAWAAQTNMLVHPARAYVGMRAARSFLRAGNPIALDLVAVNIDGKALAGSAIAVRCALLEWEQGPNGYEEKGTNVQSCDVTATDGSAKCSFQTNEGGRYRTYAVIKDAQGRTSRTSMTIWATGGNVPRDRRVEGSQLKIVTDKEAYDPGQRAEILVVAPFAPAEGVLTVNRQGIVHLERFTMKSTTQTLSFALDETHVPNVEFRVDLVGAAPPKGPAFASGTAHVRVLPTSRRLGITLTPKQPRLEPGSSTSIDVDVKDAAGKPAPNARVALVVADEAVLALSSFRTPDPIDAFYANRATDVREVGMRDRVVLPEPDVRRFVDSGDRDGDGIPDKADKCPDQPETYNGLEDQDGCPDRGRVVVEGNNIIILKPARIAVRKDFSPLALFAPRVTTDAAGRANVKMKLPDNVTRYRVMAVAALGDKQFGSQESSITARLPLTVRTSAPRFLDFGDRFELPVLVQNQTDAQMDVGIVLRAANASVGPAAKRVTIPANDRVEVRFDVTAARAGTARFQVGAASANAADASEVSVPVYTPATTEAFATYGEVDQGAIAQPVKPPSGVIPDFGGVEITTSSTALQSLTDAVLYLVKYPHECNEQVASRVLALVALRDVLGAFQAEGLPSADVMNATAKSDIEKLAKEQDPSGGWAFWSGRDPWPYLSIHVAHALVRAKEKGYAVDQAVLDRARDYLRAIDTHIPPHYGVEAKHPLVAYALYVRKRMGDGNPGRARRLISDAGGVDKLPIEAAGWIRPTLAGSAEGDAIKKSAANRVTETADSAHFTSATSDSDWLLLRSDRRADAILLEAMIGDEPQSTLIPKIVKGLLAHRTAGRWSSTQENAFVLLALDRYFETYEKTTPDFVARVWLGDRFAGEHAFHGRTTERSAISIPMRMLTAPANLLLGKDGPGRLYYRIGMQYAPKDLALPPIDRGFVVTRAYEPVDDPSDVRRVDGAWRVKAGARVRVRVTMVAPTRRYHVALVDRLPAGFEAMNAALAVTGDIPQDPKATQDKYWWWSRTWYEHENMRDDRVEAFASLLWEGVHEYVYVARATTPGTFVAPAPKAEEMYAPETFGRGANERVVIAE